MGASLVPTGHAGNPFYDVWVKDLDLAAMLDTSDIGKDRPLTSPMPRCGRRRQVRHLAAQDAGCCTVGWPIFGAEYLRNGVEAGRI